MERAFLERLGNELDEARRAGKWKELRYLASPMQPHARLADGRDVLILCSNNYLGLSAHPEVVRAGKEGLDAFGAGTASVRFICGSFEAHRVLERELAGFFKKEAALTYVSCWNANEGLVPTLCRAEDAIVSDELNHASIIDACRLSKAKRFRYAHSDMKDLEEKLKEARASGARNVLIITDGVFSMEGDLADLPGIAALADRHGAMVAVDDSHGTGVLGETGAGTAEHFGVEDRIDIITSTLGKALGGAAGGFVAGPRAVIDYLAQNSRPQIFSNALPPTVAASALQALRVLRDSPELVRDLREKTQYFRERLKEKGLKPLEGDSAIVPIMIGETAKAIAAANELLARGLLVTGFGYPVVPEGKARIRLQVSAALTREDLDWAVEQVAEVVG